jgi:hypothetical protein
MFVFEIPSVTDTSHILSLRYWNSTGERKVLMKLVTFGMKTTRKEEPLLHNDKHDNNL